MAKAKICDRCETYYMEFDEKEIRQDEFFVMTRKDHTRKDLCLKCSKELQAFMNQYHEGDSAANVEETK